MELPVLPFRNEIIETVRNNVATIICGETGSGKTSLTPLWLSEYFKVIVTQPRIVAAVEMATYVSSKVGKKIGTFVGYVTSEEENYENDTRILFVTDGLQLSRMLNDTRPNRNPTVLIIDEVHEWNMNIENIIALAKSRNIHIVIMSATMESDKLSYYLNNAPVINIPGRLFDVEKNFLPAEDLLNSLISGIRQGENVLVFLPGKRQINEMISKLDKILLMENLSHVRILPLHSEVPKEERSEVFEPLKPGEQRVIVSTNIAQTSLTIPYITLVVDSGLENRMIVQNGIEILGENNISLADIEQRAGRAGRVRPGKYILCSDFPRRERLHFPIPEINRSPLDITYLRLLNSGIRMENLDFFHQPNQTDIQQAIKTLKTFAAIDEENNITHLGRKIARMPVDLRSGVMLLMAAECGVISEITTIVACISAGDLRQKEGPWRMLTKEKTSDLLVQYDLYQFALNYLKTNDNQRLKKSWFELFKAKGIHSKNFFKARSQREMIVDACVGLLSPKKVTFKNDEERRTKVIEVIRNGFKDSIYRGSYGFYSGPAGNRTLDRESILGTNPEYVVGIPFDIKGKNARGREFHLMLLTGATLVDEEFVNKIR